MASSSSAIACYTFGIVVSGVALGRTVDPGNTFDG